MDTKPCAACERANVNPWTGLRHAGYFGCETRSISSLMGYQESVKAGEITSAYRNILQAAFERRWIEAHKAVREWAEKKNAATKARHDAIE